MPIKAATFALLGLLAIDSATAGTGPRWTPADPSLVSAPASSVSTLISVNPTATLVRDGSFGLGLIDNCTSSNPAVATATLRTQTGPSSSILCGNGAKNEPCTATGPFYVLDGMNNLNPATNPSLSLSCLSSGVATVSCRENVATVVAAPNFQALSEATAFSVSLTCAAVNNNPPTVDAGSNLVLTNNPPSILNRELVGPYSRAEAVDGQVSFDVTRATGNVPIQSFSCQSNQDWLRIDPVTLGPNGGTADVDVWCAELVDQSRQATLTCTAIGANGQSDSDALSVTCPRGALAVDAPVLTFRDALGQLVPPTADSGDGNSAASPIRFRATRPAPASAPQLAVRIEMMPEESPPFTTDAARDGLGMMATECEPLAGGGPGIPIAPTSVAIIPRSGAANRTLVSGVSCDAVGPTAPRTFECARWHSAFQFDQALDTSYPPPAVNPATAKAQSIFVEVTCVAPATNLAPSVTRSTSPVVLSSTGTSGAMGSSDSATVQVILTGDAGTGEARINNCAATGFAVNTAGFGTLGGVTLTSNGSYDLQVTREPRVCPENGPASTEILTCSVATSADGITYAVAPQLSWQLRCPDTTSVVYPGVSLTPAGNSNMATPTGLSVQANTRTASISASRMQLGAPNTSSDVTCSLPGGSSLTISPSSVAYQGNIASGAQPLTVQCPNTSVGETLLTCVSANYDNSFPNGAPVVGSSNTLYYSITCPPIEQQPLVSYGVSSPVQFPALASYPGPSVATVSVTQSGGYQATAGSQVATASCSVVNQVPANSFALASNPLDLTFVPATGNQAPVTSFQNVNVTCLNMPAQGNPAHTGTLRCLVDDQLTSDPTPREMDIALVCAESQAVVIPPPSPFAPNVSFTNGNLTIPAGQAQLPNNQRGGFATIAITPSDARPGLNNPRTQVTCTSDNPRIVLTETGDSASALFEQPNPLLPRNPLIFTADPVATAPTPPWSTGPQGFGVGCVAGVATAGTISCNVLYSDNPVNPPNIGGNPNDTDPLPGNQYGGLLFTTQVSCGENLIPIPAANSKALLIIILGMLLIGALGIRRIMI